MIGPERIARLAAGLGNGLIGGPLVVLGKLADLSINHRALDRFIDPPTLFNPFAGPSPKLRGSKAYRLNKRAAQQKAQRNARKVNRRKS